MCPRIINGIDPTNASTPALAELATQLNELIAVHRRFSICVSEECYYNFVTGDLICVTCVFQYNTNQLGNLIYSRRHSTVLALTLTPRKCQICRRVALKVRELDACQPCRTVYDNFMRSNSVGTLTLSIRNTTSVTILGDIERVCRRYSTSSDA